MFNFAHKFIHKPFFISHWHSILVIILVGAIGIATTQALFRDIEQSKHGVFVVGTLNLALEEEDGGQLAQSIFIENIGSKKNIAGEKTWKINNIGSLDGNLAFKLSSVNVLENGCNEPEALVDTSCDNPGEGQGELGSEITFEVIVGKGSDAKTLVVSDLAQNNVDQFEIQWNQANPQIKIGASENIFLTLKWYSDAGGLGNEVQSDSVTFDIIYELQQIVTQ